MEEISIRDLIRMFLRRWWILLLCTLAAGSAAYVLTHYYITPMYSAYTTLYVGKNADQVGIQTADLYLGATLIQDYREIAKSKLVAYEVIKQLGYEKMSAGAMAGKIKVTQKTDTRVIQISVNDPDPQKAMDITNTVAEVFKSKVVEIMQVENVQIIDKAELPLVPVSPNNKRNVMVGIILGLAVGIGIILLIELLDNNIKSPEDVKKHADLPVIGVIPVFTTKGRRIGND